MYKEFSNFLPESSIDSKLVQLNKNEYRYSKYLFSVLLTIFFSFILRKSVSNIPNLFLGTGRANLSYKRIYVLNTCNPQSIACGIRNYTLTCVITTRIFRVQAFVCNFLMEHRLWLRRDSHNHTSKNEKLNDTSRIKVTILFSIFF